jgi:hypothetical protein
MLYSSLFNKERFKSYITNSLQSRGFIEVEPDDHGLYSGYILPKEHSSFLWNLAWLSFISGVYAIIKGHYSLAPVPFGVWLTSLLYWRNPEPQSLLRYTDIMYVFTALSYQMWRSIGAQYANMYWIVMAITVSFYPAGVFINSTSSWLGTFCQGVVHIGGNIGNMILYSGNVKEIFPKIPDVELNHI